MPREWPGGGYGEGVLERSLIPVRFSCDWSFPSALATVLRSHVVFCFHPLPGPQMFSLFCYQGPCLVVEKSERCILRPETCLFVPSSMEPF